MDKKLDEIEQISAIKNHLKDVAVYYSESFFDKHNLEGMAMEEIMKMMAEQIQHNEQCILSMMDLVGLLILKCECFFQMQEENEIQIDDITQKFTQQLDFEKLSTSQYQAMYKEQQEKSNVLLERITQMENKLFEDQHQKQQLQRQNHELLKVKESNEANQMLVESIQRDYDQISRALQMKNEELQSKVDIYEGALLSFSNLKDEMSDMIEKLTEDLNQERSNNRAATKRADALAEEIEQMQENFQQKLNQVQAQAALISKRPSFLSTPRSNNQPRPSLIPINAYTQLLQRDMNKQMPHSLKHDLQNQFHDEHSNKASDFISSKRGTILPAILAQQLQTLNPMIMTHQPHDSKSVVVQSEDDSDMESVSSLRSSVMSHVSEKSIPYQQRRIPTDGSVQSTKPTTVKQQSHFAQMANIKRLQLEMVSRTQSIAQQAEPLRPIAEENRSRTNTAKRAPPTNGGLFKKPRESMVDMKQRRDPYEEFFILVSRILQCERHPNA